MSEMVRRMAAAQIEFDLELDEQLRGVRRVNWTAIREDRARAVLAGMREPTAAMLDAAQALPELEGVSRESLAAAWQAMIDAATARRGEEAMAEESA